MSPSSLIFCISPAGAIKSCLSPPRLRLVAQGATLYETLGLSWWDFIWWCNDLGTDWLSNRDYPYWLGWAASPPQFILSIMKAASPASVCIGPLDSQGWPVLSRWLACITDKGFLSLPQTCLSPTGSEKCWGGFTVWPWNHWFYCKMLQLHAFTCTHIHLHVPD